MLKPGLIKKISIKDFVTYAEADIYPGLNLNIVLGPNGTGKSTIVAAIILGLGGTVKTIGRGTKVSEYVRHDCTEARIDIELQSKNANKFTVTRVFNVNNQSSWYLNNKHVSETEIKDAVAKLNIQVNNLCQFLPQDRVQDFAKMNKKELLVNTQVAVGRQDLVDKQAALIKIKNEQKTLVKDMELLRSKLEQGEADVARLEGKVQNLNEKRKIMGEMEGIRRKISWLNHDKMLQTKTSVQTELNQAEKIVNKYKKKIQPVETKINEFKKLVTVLQNKLLQSRNNLNKLENRVKMHVEKAEDIENNHKEIVIEMRVKLQALVEHENEIDAMRTKIDKLVNDEQSLVDKYGEGVEIDEKARQLLQKGDNCNRQSEEVNRQRVVAVQVMRNAIEQSKNLEVKLREMENVKLKRMQILRRRDQDAYQVVEWLKDNRQLFRGQVYDPMMLELNVIDPAHTKYLENIIPMRDRVAFTCEYRDDMNLLLKHVREGLKLRINVVHSGPEHPPISAYKPAIPIEQLRQFGFFAYTNSLVTGPEAILKYLCRMYSLHGIPIGDRSTYNKASLIPEQIRLFFSDNHRFAVSTSRYTGQKSTRISDVDSDGTFSICIDFNSMNAIRKQLEEAMVSQDHLKEKIEDLEQKKQVLENKRSELLRERQSVLQNKDQIKIIRDRLEAAKQSLNHVLLGFKTADEIKQEASEKMTSTIKSSLKIHKSILTAFTDFDMEARNEERINIEMGIVNQQVTYMENEVVDLKSNYTEAQKTYTMVESAYQKAVQGVREALHAAKSLSDGFAIDDKGFDKFRTKHDALSSDLQTLQNLTHELQTRIECILTADDGELDAYEKSQALVTICRDDLTIKESKEHQFAQKMSRLREEWLEPLSALVEQINQNFGDYFESMGCAGEVQISKENGDEEYSDYGLSIRVTYRVEDPLQELNRYVQSGGERAVATAVYMISMQELTAAPFRCVDEINQGMDPQNERRIFEILVRATSKSDTCQYFLITPKLIAGLHFEKGIKIHIVHNGPFCNIDKNNRLNHSN